MKTTKRNTTLMTLAAALLALPAQLAFAEDWTPANGGVPTALWLDANDATTITKDGSDLVSQWDDKSGNARHVTQTTAANQPTYQAAGLNSKPTLYFDAASRYLTSAAVSAHSGPWSVFAVAKQAGTGVGVILAQDGSSGTRMAQYARFSSSSDIQSIAFNSAGTPFTGSMTGAVTSPCIVGSVCSSSSVTAYLDGAGGTAVPITGTLATGSRAIAVGRIDWSGLESYLNGHVSEIILVPGAVSDTDRQKFEGYLAWKWGTVASLPSGHPYKSAAPIASPSVTLTSPPNGQVYPSGTSISATATVVAGTAPYTVKFFTRSLPGGTFAQAGVALTTPPYTLDLGVLSEGSYEIYAEVTDSAGSPVTATSATHTFTVAPPIPTTITLDPTAGPTTYGDSVTFTATVSPPPSGGTVQFKNGGNSLGTPVAVNTGTGVATYTTTTLGATTHGITAEYSGSQNYESSTTAASISQVVNKAPVTVMAQYLLRLVNTANPDPLPYLITGFKNGQTLGTSGVIGTPALGTTAVLASPVGDYPITCAVGDLTASNYDFTSFVGATLTVVDGFVAVTNPSFEVGSPSSVADWSGSGGFGIQPVYGFQGITPTDGLNMAYNNGATMAQTLLSTLAPSTKYTLLVDVGDRSDYSFPGYKVRLYAGATLLAEDDSSLTPVTGWLTSKLTYTSPASGPEIGESLRIELVGDGIQINFDHVRFGYAGGLPTSGFGTWASANGATDQTPQQDHDNDGVENGIEYFMGETGSTFTAMPVLGAGNTISWPASAAYQGTYEVQTSPDLANWTNVDPRPEPSGGTLSYPLPPGAPGGKSFVRLLVTPTP